MELTEDIVGDRLNSCESTEDIQEMHSFGSMLLQECVDRLHKIDAKAGTLAGFSGAMLALIVSTYHTWSQTVGKTGIVFMFLGAISILVAGGFFLSVMRIQTFNKWISPNEWINQECLETSGMLKKYHILTMYGAVEEHERVSVAKTRGLYRGQLCMAIFGVMLTITLCKIVAISLWPPLATFFDSTRIALGQRFWR